MSGRFHVFYFYFKDAQKKKCISFCYITHNKTYFVRCILLKLSVSSVLPGAEKLFEHDLGAQNISAMNRRLERAGLLTNLGPCRKALCARRDLAIRRQLLKNDKVDAARSLARTFFLTSVEEMYLDLFFMFLPRA